MLPIYHVKKWKSINDESIQMLYFITFFKKKVLMQQFLVKRAYKVKLKKENGTN